MIPASSHGPPAASDTSPAPAAKAARATRHSAAGLDSIAAVSIFEVLSARVPITNDSNTLDTANISSDIVLWSVEGPVATITLNRPDKRNALSPELLQALGAAVARANAHPEVRVIVIRGAGKAFCAGADLGYLRRLSEYSPLENLDDSTLLESVFRSIYTSPKPVIAAVHGPAIAGGCGLATVCDIVVGARGTAVFGYSEVKIGFIPAVVMVYLLRKIGDTRARRLLLTAENIGADEAQDIGLITKAVNPEDLDSEVERLAAMLAANSASALRLTKDMLATLHGMSLESGLRYAASMNAFTRMTDDCKNGISSFLNK